MNLLRALIALFITPFILFIPIMFDELHNSWYPIIFVVGIIVYGIPNLIFLLLLKWLKIGEKFYYKIELMLAEILMLVTILYSLKRLFLLMPTNVRFYHEDGSMGVRWVFNDTAIVVYSFILLFGIIVIVDKYIFKKGKYT